MNLVKFGCFNKKMAYKYQKFVKNLNFLLLFFNKTLDKEIIGRYNRGIS